MRDGTYRSIDELKVFLSRQEQEILSQINDASIASVFVASFEEIIKKSSTAKEFINFKCKVPGCESILKCVVTV
jgi:hypothetical protein